MAAKKKAPAKKKAAKESAKKDAAPKAKRVPLVPARSRAVAPRSQEEAPDVSIITGPVIPATAQEKTERALDETISKLSAEVDAGRGDRAQLEAARKSLALLVEKRTGEQFVFTDYGFFRKTDKPPCEWKIQSKKDASGKKRAAKPMHAGRVELAMITNEDSEKLGLPPGPAVRLCVAANKPAPVVSVTDPGDALKIAARFRDCVTKEGKDPKQCGLDTIAAARSIPTSQVHIAGLGGRSRK